MTSPTRQRSSVRQPKRFKLATGQSTVFTLDVGEGGLCFESMKVPARSTEVSGSVNVAGVDFTFQGTVAWTIAGDPRVNQRGRCGVRFTKVADGFVEALRLSRPTSSAAVSAAPRPVAVPSPAVTTVSPNGPSISLQGDIWVVRTFNAAGRPQEFRCAKEAQARQLYASLRG